MLWRGRSLRILVIFSKPEGLNRRPPVRRYIFHHHAIYLYGDDFLLSLFVILGLKNY